VNYEKNKKGFFMKHHVYKIDLQRPESSQKHTITNKIYIKHFFKN